LARGTRRLAAKIAPILAVGGADNSKIGVRWRTVDGYRRARRCT
jgi:hypothetical protein